MGRRLGVIRGGGWQSLDVGEFNVTCGVFGFKGGRMKMNSMRFWLFFVMKRREDEDVGIMFYVRVYVVYLMLRKNE